MSKQWVLQNSCLPWSNMEYNGTVHSIEPPHTVPRIEPPYCAPSYSTPYRAPSYSAPGRTVYRSSWLSRGRRTQNFSILINCSHAQVMTHMRRSWLTRAGHYSHVQVMTHMRQVMTHMRRSWLTFMAHMHDSHKCTGHNSHMHEWTGLDSRALVHRSWITCTSAPVMTHMHGCTGHDSYAWLTCMGALVTTHKRD